MMPLSLAQVGEENIIKRIGGSPEVKRHLENLGFVVGGSDRGKHPGRQCDSECKGSPRGHQQRDGGKNYGITAAMPFYTT